MGMGCNKERRKLEGIPTPDSDPQKAESDKWAIAVMANLLEAVPKLQPKTHLCIAKCQHGNLT